MDYHNPYHHGVYSPDWDYTSAGLGLLLFILVIVMMAVCILTMPYPYYDRYSEVERVPSARVMHHAAEPI